MGGNALKTVKTTRKSAEDYEKIKAHVLQTLEDKLGLTGMKWRVPHEVPGKESYGDLDVLITRQSEFDIREWILLTFKPDELVCNGEVYSFNIPGFALAKDFQIDFITTPAEQFEIHHFFLSWGDCGMLIGQIAHATGLRMGQQGLFTSISDNPNQRDDLILSTDPRKICEFLGLVYTSWKDGFGSEGHIFRWLCESPYIHLVDFQRTRRGREMYMRFIDYVKEALEPPKRMPNVPALDAIITYFGKQSEFAAIVQKQADAVKRSEKFSAHLFSALGDIPGRELGQIIAGFKREIPGDFKAWVLATDESEIQVAVTGYLITEGLLPV